MQYISLASGYGTVDYTVYSIPSSGGIGNVQEAVTNRDTDIVCYWFPTLNTQIQYHLAESIPFCEQYIWDIALQLVEVLHELFTQGYFQCVTLTKLLSSVVLTKFGFIDGVTTKKLLLQDTIGDNKCNTEQQEAFERESVQELGLLLLTLCTIFSKAALNDLAGSKNAFLHPSYLCYSTSLHQFIEGCILGTGMWPKSIENLLQTSFMNEIKPRVAAYKACATNFDTASLIVQAIQADNEVIFSGTVGFLRSYTAAVDAMSSVVAARAYHIMPILCEHIYSHNLVYPLPVIFGTEVGTKPYLFDLVEAGKHDKIASELDKLSCVYGNMTALMLSVSMGHYLCTRMLLCGMGIANNDGKTALMLSAIRNSPSSAKLLLTEMTTLDMNGYTALMYAAENNSLETLMYLLYECTAVNSRGQTALMIAASRGHTDCVRILVSFEYGKRCHKGKLAIQYALENDYPACVRLLLDCEVALLPTKGKTPLMIAAKSGHAEIIRMILPLKKGATSNLDKTALLYGIDSDTSPDILLPLYEIEGAVWTKNGYALHYAIANKRHRHILNLRAYNGLMDRDGRLPIDCAVQQNDMQCMFYILAGFAYNSFNQKIIHRIINRLQQDDEKSRSSLIHLLVTYLYAHESTEYLHLLASFQVEQPTELMNAAKNSLPQVACEHIEQAGAVYRGKTALIMAVEANSTDCVKLLTRHEFGIITMVGGAPFDSALVAAARCNRRDFLPHLIDELYLMSPEMRERLFAVRDGGMDTECFHDIGRCRQLPVSEALECPYSARLENILYAETHGGEKLVGLLACTKRQDVEAIQKFPPKAMYVQTPRGISPLMIAVETQFTWGITHFLPSYRLRDCEGKTALVRGIEQGLSEELLAPLLQTIGAINNGVDTPLTYVIRVHKLEYLEASMPLFWELAPNGKTALQVAEEMGNKDIVARLLEHRKSLQSRMTFFTETYDSFTLVPTILRRKEGRRRSASDQ